MNLKRTLIFSMAVILTLLTLPQKAKAEVVGKIEAHVGNKIITSYDIESLDPKVYKQILAIKDKDEKETQLNLYKSQALDFLINQYIIDIAAEREGIKVTEQEIDKAIDEIAKNNKLDRKKLISTLEKEGLSLEKYRYQIKNQIVNARIRNQVLMPKVVITDEDMRKMADEKADELSLKNRYDINIITAQTKKDIEKVLKEYKAGADFKELAKKYSLDASAVDGGALGSVDMTYAPIEMEKALEGLKKGDITKPFKYEGLWAVCYVNEFKSRYDYDENTANILRNAIGEKLFADVFEKWLNRHKETIVVLKSGKRFDVKGK